MFKWKIATKAKYNEFRPVLLAYMLMNNEEMYII